MATVRLAQLDDLQSLLGLYAATGFSAPARPDTANTIWQALINSPHTDVVVATLNHDVVSSCTLITAPNLLRGGHSHGFLENVATHPDHRGKGFGTATVQFALDRAWERGCYHVMLQSGRDDVQVKKFYRKQGFKPGLRTAYVVERSD